MTDTIIKGTGNSRSIKSVPNLAALAPTYDKLLEYLTGEGLPVDIGPLNEAGVDVHGTDLTKSNLLKDTTAALYGLGTAATVDNVLSKGLLRCKTGNYKGTGNTAQGSTPYTVIVGFRPKIFFICAASTDFWAPQRIIQSDLFAIFFDHPEIKDYYIYSTSSATQYAQNAIRILDNGVSWWNRSGGDTRSTFQMSGYTYYWLAIG